MIDANVTPKYDVPLWNETRWNGCWNPAAGVGVYVHAGRYRHDLDLWWAQVAVYLPGEALCVTRVWGPNTSRAGLSFAGLELAIREDGWTLTFDGAGQLTSVAALARAPRGESAPVRRLRIALEARAAAPAWDLYAGDGDGERQDFAGDAHVQQAFTTSGAISVTNTPWTASASRIIRAVPGISPAGTGTASS